MNIKQEIIDTIQIIVNAAIKQNCLDIAFGIVQSVEDRNKCTVKINGVDCKVVYYGKSSPIVKTKYPVFIPFDKMSLAFIITGGDNGKTGTTNYNELENKPSINNVVLNGNKTSLDLQLSNILYNTTEEWNKEISLIGKLNTIYVYTDYYELENGKKSFGIKIGDGKAYLIDSPFIDGFLKQEIENHIDNTIVHINDEERAFWNNKARCYLSPFNAETLIFTTD